MTSKIGIPQNQDVVFQVTDWSTSFDEIDVDDESILQYVIKMFGITKNGEKVFVKVNGFNPYFYVKIPESWTKRQVDILMDLED